MQESISSISLKNLATLETLLYHDDKIPSSKKTEFYKIQYGVYDRLTKDQLFTINDKLNQESAMQENKTLLSTLYNIDRLDPSIEKIKYNIIERIMKTTTTDGPIFLTELFEANRKRYLIIEEFEYELRNLFIFLLANHLESSNKMSQTYRSYIYGVLKKIKFIYNNQRKINPTVDVNIEDYIYSNVYEMYLHNLIEITIKKILTYKDEDLENDIKYAEAICYQTLLRSLFIILDDYNYLAEYADLYNELETEETIAKSIVKSSFISNYKDTMTYKRKKNPND